MPTPKEPTALIKPAFYERGALDVARDLLGATLIRDRVALRITEVEAYCGESDSACHATSGRTRRNASLWGPAGRSYIYLCYGIHFLLNVVTATEGNPQAVLIRGCEPLRGEELIETRRNGIRGPAQLDGPGKVGAALDLNLDLDGDELFRSGGLELRRGRSPKRIVTGPRIGIDYAEPHDRNAPWRLADGDSRYVGRRRELS